MNALEDGMEMEGAYSVREEREEGKGREVNGREVHGGRGWFKMLKIVAGKC